jgi:hypothetical protein
MDWFLCITTALVVQPGRMVDSEDITTREASPALLAQLFANSSIPSRSHNFRTGGIGDDSLRKKR